MSGFADVGGLEPLRAPRPLLGVDDQVANGPAPGTCYATAVMEHTGSPSRFYKSVLSWNPAAGWEIRCDTGRRVRERALCYLRSRQVAAGHAYHVRHRGIRQRSALQKIPTKVRRFRYNRPAAIRSILAE